jgi:ABC-type Na+ efflux pump permease subunit
VNGIGIMLHKEWRCFAGSDRGIFLLYAILLVSWSLMLATPDTNGIAAGPIWLIFFSVVISANFSNTVFIAERVNGILEILLTSGLSRRSILFGKMAFVAGMSILIGLACMLIAPVWRIVIYQSPGAVFDPGAFLLYCSAVYMNTASSAYLSVKMNNPRLLHLANILLLAVLVATHTVAAMFIPLPASALALVMLGIGIAATTAARKLFDSEKILQPVIF